MIRLDTSYNHSSSLWVNDVIWFRKLAVLLGGKNLARKVFVSSSHVVIDPRGNECSHALTLSLSENGNRRRRMASVDAPLIFRMSYTSRKLRDVGWDPLSAIHQIETAGPWKLVPTLVRNFWQQLVVLWCPGFDCGQSGSHKPEEFSSELLLLPIKMETQLVMFFLFLIYEKFSLLRDQTRKEGFFT